MRQVLEYVKEGRVDFLITEISFDGIPQGLQRLRQGKVDGGWWLLSGVSCKHLARD